MRTIVNTEATLDKQPSPATGAGRISVARVVGWTRALAITVLFASMPGFAGAIPLQAVAQAPHSVALLEQTTAADHLLFVDHAAAGTGDGLSWQNAFAKLQDALTLARTLAPAESVEIWVAQGRYFPDVGAGMTNNDRKLSFEPAANVAMYGGFAGVESLREQRDWLAHSTVLSGDIDGNDTVDANGVAQSTEDIVGNNSYHVVLLNEINGSAVLDGFTITSGQATGGGLFNGILMRHGAGLHIQNSNATLTHMKLQGNLARLDSGSGGGIYFDSDLYTDQLTLRDVEFVANAAAYGGGLAASGAKVDSSSTTFLRNEAFAGGAAYLSLLPHVTFRDSIFRGNSASTVGGAVYGFRENIALVNCELTGNTAAGDGGAYYSGGTTLDLNIVMTNVVISGNRAGNAGGGIYRQQPAFGRSRLWNTIIWNNEDSSGVGTAEANHGGPGASRLVAVNSLVQGMIAPGTDNLDGTLAASDPLFLQSIDPSTAPSLAGNFHVQLSSPIIDRGDNQARINPYSPPTAIPLEGNVLTDLDGSERIFDGDGDTNAVVDLGPYEVSPFTIGGMVNGLQGAGLVLQNNSGDDLHIAANGAFTFGTVVANASSYVVTVASQPDSPQQTCVVSDGSGTVSGSNVTDIQVTCTTSTFTIGGMVSGLEGEGLILQNNNADDLPIATNGSFTFATAVVDQGGYAVTVATQPSLPSQTCTVTNGIDSVSGANITDVAVICTTNTYTVTPISGAGGSLSPATPQSVASQQTIGFTIAADPGYDLDEVGGSCGGTLAGVVFTTPSIDADCTVQASFVPQTSTATTTSANPVRAGQAVEFSLDVQGIGAAPVDGRIDLVSSTGESCSDTSAPEINGTVASFACSISFNTVGSRQMVATYSASTTHSGSVAAALAIAVKRFADVSVEIDDGELLATPGAPASYLIALRNAGPDDAPNTQFILAANPALIDANWICSAVGTAVCPAASGSGELTFSVNLPSGSGLDFIQDGTLPTSLPLSVIVQAQATISEAAPDDVFDPATGNNSAIDTNDADTLFKDGFEL